LFFSVVVLMGKILKLKTYYSGVMKKLLLFSLLYILFFAFCTQTGKKAAVQELPSIAVKSSDFESVVQGKEVNLFNLVNKNGMVVQLTNYGARIVSVLLPATGGEYVDVVLGYNTIEEYLQDGITAGCVVGRYANRIAKGSFELDGIRYQLEINNNENTVHSGSSNFARFVWDACQEGDSVVMHYVSPHMDGGFPGELHVTVIYVLTDDNQVEIIYEAVTSKKTVINLTNHSYFNLAGEGSGDISRQYIMINADYITQVNEQLIPTGQFLPVVNTPFDLRQEVRIGKMIDDPHQQIVYGRGYDHNWVLNKQTPDELSHAVSCRDEGTGIRLNVYTTKPGLQLYTGNFMKGTVTGKSGSLYHFRNGFALEAQHFPDSPNHPSFPSTVLEPGAKYYQKTILEFQF
jgi:aldose 1-epimerase